MAKTLELLELLSQYDWFQDGWQEMGMGNQVKAIQEIEKIVSAPPKSAMRDSDTIKPKRG